MWCCKNLCRFVKHDVRRRVLAHKLRFSKLRCARGYLRKVSVVLDWSKLFIPLFSISQCVSNVAVTGTGCFSCSSSGYMLVQRWTSGAVGSFFMPCCVGRFRLTTTTCRPYSRRSAMGFFSLHSIWTLQWSASSNTCCRWIPWRELPLERSGRSGDDRRLIWSIEPHLQLTKPFPQRGRVVQTRPPQIPVPWRPLLQQQHDRWRGPKGGVWEVWVHGGGGPGLHLQSQPSGPAGRRIPPHHRQSSHHERSQGLLPGLQPSWLLPWRPAHDHVWSGHRRRQTPPRARPLPGGRDAPPASAQIRRTEPPEVKAPGC